MQKQNKTCTGCNETKGLEDFYQSKGRFQSECKKCIYKRVAELQKGYKERNDKYGVQVDTKRCPTCKETKAAEEFGKKINTLDGLYPYCKKCKNNYSKSSAARYSALKTQANKHKREVGINLEQHICLLKDNTCYYCHKPLQESGSGLDRIDSSKGYTINNVRPCCKICNSAKLEMSEEEFYSHIEAIYKTAKNRGAL